MLTGGHGRRRLEARDDLEFAHSAFKHGIPREDIEHAISAPLVLADQEYDGETRAFLIGFDRAGRPLEIVLVPADDPRRVIHADRLRPKFYDLLR
ncbi:DUF4258 domain-containing protein [Salana multivorans]